jgi:glycosyltransferase involved in cell wall biosynthesis
VNFLVFCPFRGESIADQMGKADYSYHFVLGAFRPVLEQLGDVIDIDDPLTEVDPLYRELRDEGIDSVFLSFTPPHRVPRGLQCPTIPVFAWEYDSIPDENWFVDACTDWSKVLGQLGWAITHSEFAVAAVKRALRKDFPVVSVPAPVWDRFAPLARRRTVADRDGDPIRFHGTLIDSHQTDVAAETSAVLDQNPDSDHALTLGGVVYCSVFCPLDGRKNWEHMVTAFCFAFRDNPDATLVLKVVHYQREPALTAVLLPLRTLLPFRCRVVIVFAYLDDENYGKLIVASDFVVNTSYGEGQCIPLMEFMSAGTPAIAPDHTAMQDYLDASCGVVLRYGRDWANWPHDPRLLLKTRRFAIEWDSLFDAYRTSYSLRRSNGSGYRNMCAAATESLRRHCSKSVAIRRMRNLLRAHARASREFAPDGERRTSFFRNIARRMR